jgi:hypothetical protein
MSNIEQCKSVEELKKFSMQDLSSLYAKIVKAPPPKFSDKGAAANRILPLLQQKQLEQQQHEMMEFSEFMNELSNKQKAIASEMAKRSCRDEIDETTVVIKKVRGRPRGLLSSRKYVIDFDKFWLKQRELPPQAKQIIESLSKTNRQEFVEFEIPILLDLKTKQDPWRIFQYYRPKLIAAGVVKVINAS